jgi:hypothetical protein
VKQSLTTGSVNDGELDRSGDDKSPTDSDDISTRVIYNIQYIFLSTSRFVFIQIKEKKIIIMKKEK